MAAPTAPSSDKRFDYSFQFVQSYFDAVFAGAVHGANNALSAEALKAGALGFGRSFFVVGVAVGAYQDGPSGAVKNAVTGGFSYGGAVAGGFAGLPGGVPGVVAGTFLGGYSGMRMGEIVQLLIADVKKEDGIWFFQVTKSEGDNKKGIIDCDAQRSSPEWRRVRKTSDIQVCCSGEAEITQYIPLAQSSFAANKYRAFRMSFPGGDPTLDVRTRTILLVAAGQAASAA